MKEYYYLNNNEQFGPFSTEELQTKGITSETLIWTDEMEEWKKVKDVPDLMNNPNFKKVPPPPPDIGNQNSINKTEVTGNLNVTPIKTPNEVIDAIRPGKTSITWLLIWVSFHLLALLFSYSKIEIFNRAGFYHSEKFWPFVDFIFDYENGNKYFYGILHEYDWTEFLFYVGSGFIVYLFIKLSNKKTDGKI
jgi:hypothetical protein